MGSYFCLVTVMQGDNGRPQEENLRQGSVNGRFFGKRWLIGSNMKSWIQDAAAPAVVIRGLKYACIVGIVLVLINHGDTIVGGKVTPVIGGKILLNFVFPYLVSTLSSVGAIRNG